LIYCLSWQRPLRFIRFIISHQNMGCVPVTEAMQRRVALS
jgi:hypothetical protein